MNSSRQWVEQNHHSRQIASVNAALQKVALGLVDQHLRHCVMEAVTASPEAGEQRLAEAILAVERLAQL